MVIPINLSNNRKIVLVITGPAEILEYHYFKNEDSSSTKLENFITSALKNSDSTDSLHNFIEGLCNNISNIITCPLDKSFEIQTVPEFTILDFKATISELKKLIIILSAK